MALVITCQCGGRFKIKPEHSGKRFLCPRCGRALAAEPADQAHEFTPATSASGAPTQSEAKPATIQSRPKGASATEHRSSARSQPSSSMPSPVPPRRQETEPFLPCVEEIAAFPVTSRARKAKRTPVKRRTIAAAAGIVLAGAIAGGLWFLDPFSRVNQAAFDMIEPGMTLAKVEALLGPGTRPNEALEDLQLMGLEVGGAAAQPSGDEGIVSQVMRSETGKVVDHVYYVVRQGRYFQIPTRTYVWESGGRQICVVFTAGQVIFKYQKGLERGMYEDEQTGAFKRR